MIWRVLVVVVCIIIVVSAVWAASNSFEVRVDGPNTFGKALVIPTPTPVALPVDYAVGINIDDDGDSYRETLRIDMPLPKTHVVLMEGSRSDKLQKFHLCSGTVRHCSGGILSLNAAYVDRQGDGIADRLRIYFDWEEVASLLENAIDTNASVEAGATVVISESAIVSDPVVSEPVVGESTQQDNTVDSRHLRKYVTVSGSIYAWKIAQP